MIDVDEDEIRRLTFKFGMAKKREEQVCVKKVAREFTTQKQYACKFNRKKWLIEKIDKYKKELKKIIDEETNNK